MSIENITLENRFSTCGITANDDGTYNGTGSEVYIVSFDTADDPRSRPYIARSTNQTVNGVRIPAMWESHPYEQFIYVKDKQVAMADGPLHWRVTVYYEYVANPLNEPYTAEWMFVDSYEPIDRDRQHKALVNSADEPFDPPIQEEAHDIILRIVRNEQSYNPLVASNFKKSVNESQFLWFPPQTVKCPVYESVRMRKANLFYCQVKYEFAIRTDMDSESQYIGWKRRILDQGFREKTGNNENGQPKYALIKDDDGSPVSQPVLLNGSGERLAAEADPVFLTFETKNLMDFSVLGFGINDPAFYTGVIE